MKKTNFFVAFILSTLGIFGHLMIIDNYSWKLF